MTEDEAKTKWRKGGDHVKNVDERNAGRTERINMIDLDKPKHLAISATPTPQDHFAVIAMTARETAQAAVELLPVIAWLRSQQARDEEDTGLNDAALGLLIAALELLRGVAAGTDVIVPKEPTERMLYKGGDHERSH